MGATTPIVVVVGMVVVVVVMVTFGGGRRSGFKAGALLASVMTAKRCSPRASDMTISMSYGLSSSTSILSGPSSLEM